MSTAYTKLSKVFDEALPVIAADLKTRYIDRGSKLLCEAEDAPEDSVLKQRAAYILIPEHVDAVAVLDRAETFFDAAGFRTNRQGVDGGMLIRKPKIPNEFGITPAGEGRFMFSGSTNCYAR